MLDSVNLESDVHCQFYNEKRKRFCKSDALPDYKFCNNHAKCQEINDISIGVNYSSSNDRSSLKEDRCQYYLMKKFRYCRMYHTDDSVFCTEHRDLITNSEGTHKRIPCPLDNRHTCYERLLEQHLKKCNSREELRPAYYVHNINTEPLCDDEDCKMVDWSSVDFEKIMKLIDTVRNIHKGITCIQHSDYVQHPVLINELSNTENGDHALKHLSQLAALLSLMENDSLIDSDACYVEFGAGKGGLSHWIEKSLENSSNSNFFLVEKGGVRYKKDVYHRNDNSASFERLRIDIQHLDLEKAMRSSNKSGHIIGIGKHVCGAATDVSLKCLGRLVDNEECDKREIKGIMLALCCHHRCTWREYVGKDFLLNLGFTSADFSYLVKMCSWATCDTENQININHAKFNYPKEDGSFNNYNHVKYGNLKPVQREEIGYMCKNIIDEGRIHYLKQLGFDASLKYYIDKSVTLENCCLIAKQL